MMKAGKKGKRVKYPCCGFLLRLDGPAALENRIYCPDCEAELQLPALLHQRSIESTREFMTDDGPWAGFYGSSDNPYW